MSSSASHDRPAARLRPRSDSVGIKMLADFHPGEGYALLTAGTEYLVSSATATGLIMCGAAIRHP
jgi:hypothetical protein